MLEAKWEMGMNIVWFVVGRRRYRIAAVVLSAVGDEACEAIIGDERIAMGTLAECQRAIEAELA